MVSLEKVQAEHLHTTFIVYDDEGDIHYKGHAKPDDMRKYKGKKLVEMRSGHISFMEESGRSMAQFIVEEDEYGNHCYIQICRQITYDVDKEFLTEILQEENDSWDIKVSVQQTKFIVFLKSQKENKRQYCAVHNSTHDPHILYEKLNDRNINDLQKNKVMEFKKDYNLNDFSIYTVKLYDKYVRS